MLESSKNIYTKQGSEKSFGVVFSIVFLIIALYPLFGSEGFRLWALIMSALFLFLAFFVPKILIIPNNIWFKLGLFLGSIIAPIVMMIVYFIAVLPTGLIMRLLGKDLLKRKIDNDTDTYWIERVDSMGSMKNQF